MIMIEEIVSLHSLKLIMDPLGYEFVAEYGKHFEFHDTLSETSLHVSKTETILGVIHTLVDRSYDRGINQSKEINNV